MNVARTIRTCASALALLLGVAAVHAQSTTESTVKTSSALEEVVVTAQRRSENLQDIALAITALSSEELANSQVVAIDDLTGEVPNFRVSSNQGTAYVFLRGVGNNVLNVGGDGSVAVHQDGVFIASPRAQLGAYFDLNRIEVVRGPQGDLYGRNATGGSINIITNKPTDDLSFTSRASLGNYGLVNAEAALSGPLFGDVLTARLAGFIYRRDGFGENDFTGTDIDDRESQAGRLTVSFKPSDEFNLELVGEYYDQSDASGSYHYLGQAYPELYPQPRGTYAPYLGVRAEGERDIASSVDPQIRNESHAYSATATYEVSNSLSLKSITGYRDWSSFLQGDLDTSNSAKILRRTSLETGHQFSQELQALVTGQRFDLVLGGYYFNSGINGYTLLDKSAIVRLCGTPPTTGCSAFTYGLSSGSLQTDAYAAFANAKFDLTDRLRGIVGLRYSYEERATEGFNVSSTPPGLSAPVDGEEDFEAFTPKLGLQFDLSPETMLYATAGRGFKSGSFAVGFAALADPPTTPQTLVALPPLEPEYVWNYEVGAKSRFWDDRLQINVTAFWYDYTDLVTQRVSAGYLITENAAAATIRGAEFELTALPMRNLRLSASLGYLDAKYDEYTTPNPAPYATPVGGYPNQPPTGNPPAGFPLTLDLSGNRLPQAPEWTARGAFEYGVPLNAGARITIGADAQFSSRVYFDQYQSRFNSEADYTIINARLGYESGRQWSVGLWGKNLTDELVVAASIITSPDTYYARVGYLQDPLTYGVDVRVDF